MNGNNMTRIGVFYDGDYFFRVSDYYHYQHDRKSRISVAGLHRFIRTQIAKEERSDPRSCQIVDAHYFRSRVSAADESTYTETVYSDRMFDDVLAAEGVTTHNIPARASQNGKGIEAWLALEAFEQAYSKRLDVVVLVASDWSYVPLVKKLNTLGTRVMVIGWDFEHTEGGGEKTIGQTLPELFESAIYSVALHEIIDNRAFRNDPVINGLLMPRQQVEASLESISAARAQAQAKSALPPLPIEKSLVGMKRKFGRIKALKDGFGFIENQPRDAFFFHSDLMECAFGDLEVGYRVEFKEETKPNGEIVAKELRVIDGKY
ncbi:MAG: NYN domain-containing protein [Alistipes sp.]|jgi:uncharacterized LabA/DUF88 family protein/cold shock CspA family protein|nr:NYN domain-containing protein [Alistipes sp.]